MSATTLSDLPTAPLAKPDALRSIDTRQLFAGAKLVEIRHAGQYYVLRITRENRLILTK